MTDQTRAIKVFISHATEDKNHFVRDFATKLRASGIDAWVDEWEMMPGDSLVDKIFEEGLKNAAAVIVVLSNVSITKPWVREELNAAIINRISKQTRVIPVIIDECKVPESIKSTLWQRIADVNSYDVEFQRIISSIYGVMEKPALGAPPKYVQVVIDKIPGISKVDTLVLKTACELSLEDGRSWVHPPKLFERLRSEELTDADIEESISILKDRFLVDVSHVMSGRISSFRINPRGFENYAKFFRPDFDALLSAVMLAILNNNLGAQNKIAEHLSLPPILVEYIMEILIERKLITANRYGGGIHVFEITTLGKRFARQLG